MFKLPISIITLTFWVLLHPPILAQEEESRFVDTPSPLESESDHFGGLRNYGPVALNDVTGRVRVVLPRVGPSPLLSVQPLVRTQLSFEDTNYLFAQGHLIDNFNAMGLGGSMGWGHFYVINPTEDVADFQGGREMTYYEQGGGGPVPFQRDYLYQTSNANPTWNQPQLFTYQNTLDRYLRRMTWKDPSQGGAFLGDYVLLLPSGRKVTFGRRIWASANVNDGLFRRFYPIKVEDPNGEWVAITYLFDANGNQSAMMDTMVDNHGRTLEFTYEEPLLAGRLKEIRLFAPGETPQTDPGLFLAGFTYMENGLTTPEEENLKSLRTMTTSGGHVWTLDWNTSDPAFALEKVTTPTGGAIHLRWKQTIIRKGRYPGLPMTQVTQWRVDQVRLALPEEERTYGYNYNTTDVGEFIDGALVVTITGPEGLSQVTNYTNMASRIVTGADPKVVERVQFPFSGYPIDQKTTYKGITKHETWEYEILYLWASEFQPPLAGLFGNPVANAVNWTVRPKFNRVWSDNHWIDTEYGYGFTHNQVGMMVGSPSMSLLSPIEVTRSPRGGAVEVKQSLEYKNFGRIGGECHEYQGDTLYARSLPTVAKNIYTDAQGLETLLGHTSTLYERVDLPYPTANTRWASPTEGILTKFDYYDSGPYKGKLKSEQVGANPLTAIQTEAYLFGLPQKSSSPLMPLMEVAIDFRGNTQSITEAGVTTGFDYDLSDRVILTTQPTMMNAITQYSPPDAPNPTASSFYGHETNQKQRQQSTADGWNRPTEAQRDITPALTGTETIQYNALGQAATRISPSGSKESAETDVHGRPTLNKLTDASGTLIQETVFQYERFPDGSSQVTQTTTRDHRNLVKITLTDFVGRPLKTSLNEDQGGSQDPEDFTAGGHTLFTYTQDPATGLTTTTIKPYGETGLTNRIEVRDLLGRAQSIQDPEWGGGSVVYAYDDRSLVRHVTNPDGKKFQFTYDAAGRLTEQRLRTQVAPERFDLLVLKNSYHPIHGYLETQVKKLGTSPTRVTATAETPDALGRPTTMETKLPEPSFWNPELTRDVTVTASGTPAWQCRWRPLPDGSGLAAEYLLELKPFNEERASLYFPHIRQAGEQAPWIEFMLSTVSIQEALAVQLLNHPNRDAWLADLDRGTQMGTVLDPEKSFGFRVTGIDTQYQSTQPSYWWGDLPDLVVDSIDVALDGLQTSLDLRIFNAGSRRAAASETVVYLSPTATLSHDAPVVATFTTPAIEPGFAVLHSVEQMNVADFAYVVIAVDTGQAVTELDENNNLGREFLAHVGEHDPEKPDVLVEEMHVAYVDVGEQIETYATYAIQNTNTTRATHQDGTSSPGNSTTKLYMSSDNIISNDDLFLAATECAPLGPSGREIQTTNLGAVGTAVPLHSTHMVAVANGGIDEEPQFHEGTNRFNNVSTVELPQLAELGPDLVIPSFVHEGVSGGPGNLTMVVTFTLHNKGVWKAGASKVGFFYSTTPLVIESHQPLTLTNGTDSVTMDPIHPGWDTRLMGSATLSIPSAQGYLIVRADVEDTVVESDEANNWKAHTFAGYADLVVDGFGLDTASGRVTFRIKNIDNLPSEPTNVALYLDFEDQFHPFRSVSVWEAPLPELAPGDTSADFVTPPGWQPPASNRDQFLFAMADSDQLVHERDESNNHSHSLLVEGTGASGGKPDLLAQSWGFTRDIWPDPPTLTAPDVQISEFIAWWDPPWSAKPLQGSYRVRVAVGAQPIEAHFQVILSADATFGNGDDVIVKEFDRVFEEDTDEVFLIAGPGGAPRDFIQVVATTPNVDETRSTNNTATTRFSLPRVNAVHSLTNSSHAGCGPFTVEVYMSGNNEPVVSPGDDLIGLYIHPGFSHADTHPAPMIAYDGTFLDSFAPLQDWTMKFVVDSLDTIEESDETNNVLVVDPNPANYHGPWLPRGLDPLPDPNEGTLAGDGPEIDRTTTVTQIQANGFQALDGNGLMELRFKMINHGKGDLRLDNLNIFASYDFGIKGAATLVFSSALAGDSQGNKTIPATIPNRGETGEISYRIRVPKHFLGSQYKLVFVANAHVKSTGNGATLLSFSDPEAQVLGFLEPARLGGL